MPNWSSCSLVCNTVLGCENWTYIDRAMTATWIAKNLNTCPPNQNNVFWKCEIVRLIFFSSGQVIGSVDMCPQIKSIWFLGVLHLKSWWTLGHVSGHVTCVMFILRIHVDRPWVVDYYRHWNFSICSKDIWVMAVLLEGCNWKIQGKNGLLWGVPFFAFLLIIPLH